eukprot:2140816-Pyramimonas_sp.AAC.1
MVRRAAPLTLSMTVTWNSFASPLSSISLNSSHARSSPFHPCANGPTPPSVTLDPTFGRTLALGAPEAE